MSAENATKLIRGVLFDFDGTLTEFGSLDFGVIKDAIGCPLDRPVLEFILGLESEKEKTRAFGILDRFEAEAARRSRPNEGAEETLEFLRQRNLKTGIISRNSLVSIQTSLQNFRHVRPDDFTVILSRDDPYRPKPDPEGILAAARMLGVPVSQVLVIGDFIFDVEAGHKAGALTAFLTNRGKHSCAYPSDFTLQHLGDLKEIIRYHAPLPPGKLPNDLLQRFLAEAGSGDAPLLLAPGVGEDAAALALAGEQVLVLKSDPITFPTEFPGLYAVAVNVNDIATTGATPRWLLASLLFPVGVNAVQIRKTMRDLQAAAHTQGLVVCGGHTEVTDAVTRPVIAAQTAGTVARADLIDKRNMAESDRIVLTKALAIEGTSILARTCAGRLREFGMDEHEISRSRNFVTDPGISILKEARIAARTGKVTAMHDITEGGLATALQELSCAGGHRLRICFDRIPVYAETGKICGLLGVSPLGLIGSGSLLICCERGAAAFLIADLEAAGIAAVEIGEVLEAGNGIEAVDARGYSVPWPVFETDELARLISMLGDNSQPRKAERS